MIKFDKNYFKMNLKLVKYLIKFINNYLKINMKLIIND